MLQIGFTLFSILFQRYDPPPDFSIIHLQNFDWSHRYFTKFPLCFKPKQCPLSLILALIHIICTRAEEGPMRWPSGLSHFWLLCHDNLFMVLYKEDCEFLETRGFVSLTTLNPAHSSGLPYGSLGGLNEWLNESYMISVIIIF